MGIGVSRSPFFQNVNRMRWFVGYVESIKHEINIGCYINRGTACKTANFRL